MTVTLSPVIPTVFLAIFHCEERLENVFLISYFKFCLTPARHTVRSVVDTLMRQNESLFGKDFLHDELFALQ